MPEILRESKIKEQPEKKSTSEKLEQPERREVFLEKEAATEVNEKPEITDEAAAGLAGQLSQRHSLKERQQEIENILAEDLEDIYLNMSPAKQAEFKLAGEEVAGKINDLLARAKVKVKAVIDLIKKWLSLIPGINKFFLEQEAKIKTDKILQLNIPNN